MRFRFNTLGPAKLQTVEVQELLIPISEKISDYLYVRANGRLRAFGKWRCEREQELRRVLVKAALLR